MTINARQFEQLTEMGIPLWQSRSSNKGPDNVKAAEQAPDLSLLAQQQCFLDIIQALNLSIGEITIQGNRLNLGLFNWLFLEDATLTTDTPATKAIEIDYRDNQLFTPSMSLIAKSPALKKTLWHVLNTKIL